MAFKRIKNGLHYLHVAGEEFIADNVIKLSASLAYYTVFSIGPLLLVIMSILGLLYEQDMVTLSVNNQLYQLIGQEGATGLINILQKIREQRDAAHFSTIGVIILIVGATTIFADIQDSINYIWSIRAKPKRGWLKFLKDRLLSFSMIVGLGFLLIVSLLVNTFADLVTERLVFFFEVEGVILFRAINMLILFLVVALLFGVIYKVLPDARIHWKDAAVGATLTSVLFLVGKLLIGLYLAKSDVASVYGGAASIIIILSWVYYTAIILYYGAEFTKVYAIKAGHGIHVSNNAVFIIKREAKELPEWKLSSTEKLLHTPETEKPEQEDKDKTGSGQQ